MTLPRQVLDFSQASGFARRERGFLVFEPAEGETRKVPLDSILALILTSRQVTLSAALLAALAEQGSAVVICGPNMLPIGLMTPLVGNIDLTQRAAAQVAMGVPLQKRLWKDLVRAKIRAQAAVLALAAPDRVARLENLAKTLKSGDPENHEAQAAQVYWPALMGKAFRRRPEAGDANVHLNYGYAIVRACMARAVVAAGLLPALGLFHKNARNPMVLVDDLMEPFRPVVDWAVCSLGGDPGPLDAPAKAKLVALTNAQVAHERGGVSLAQGCHDLATSLALVLLNQRKSLDLPTYSALTFAPPTSA